MVPTPAAGPASSRPGHQEDGGSTSATSPPALSLVPRRCRPGTRSATRSGSAAARERASGSTREPPGGHQQDRDASTAPTMLFVTVNGPIAKSGSALIETWSRPPLVLRHRGSPRRRQATAAATRRLRLYLLIASACDVPDRVHRRPDPEHHPDQREDRARAEPVVQQQSASEADDHRDPQSQSEVEGHAPVRRSAAPRCRRPDGSGPIAGSATVAPTRSSANEEPDTDGRDQASDRQTDETPAAARCRVRSRIRPATAPPRSGSP